MSSRPLWGLRGVSPGGIAPPCHVHVAAGINSDAVSIVVTRRPIEGVPLVGP